LKDTTKSYKKDLTVMYCPTKHAIQYMQERIDMLHKQS